MLTIEQKAAAGQEILSQLPAGERRPFDLTYADYVETFAKSGPIEAAYAVYCAGFYSGTEYQLAKEGSKQ